MDIYLVFTTDLWHTHASRDLIAIASSESKAMTMCSLNYCKRDNASRISIGKESLQQLKDMWQTQGLDENLEIEYVIEKYEVNHLL
jgi:predicted xylose isomerase-like sugar epimerase